MDETWGRKRIVVKSDKESALRDVQRKLKEAMVDEMIIENSPTGDSKSNGLAERSVQEFEDMMRTWMCALEGKYGVTIPSKHPIVAWLVEYIGELYNHTSVGSDGKTPFRRLHGKDGNLRLMPFGEKVWWKRERSPEVNITN